MEEESHTDAVSRILSTSPSFFSSSFFLFIYFVTLPFAIYAVVCVLTLHDSLLMVVVCVSVALVSLSQRHDDDDYETRNDDDDDDEEADFSCVS